MSLAHDNLIGRPEGFQISQRADDVDVILNEIEEVLEENAEEFVRSYVQKGGE